MVIASLVFLPSLAASVSGVLLAQSAAERAETARSEDHDLTVLRTVRLLDASVAAEMAFYEGWLRLEDLDALSASDPMLAAVRMTYTAQQVAAVDAHLATLDGITDRFDNHERAAAGRLPTAIGAARAAFEVGDLRGLGLAVETIDANLSIVDQAADRALATNGGSWLIIDREAALMKDLSVEVATSGPLLFASSLSDAERQQAAILADRTERSFQEVLVASPASARQGLRAARESLDQITALRSLIANGSVMGSGGERYTDEVISIATSVEEFSDIIAHDLDANAARLAADARQRVSDAEQQQTLLWVLVVIVVVVPMTVVVQTGVRVNARVARLQKASERVSAGEFHLAPLDEMGEDELSVFAASFNEMIGTISNTHDLVTAFAEGETDQRMLDELPGEIGQSMRAALAQLGSAQEELAHRASHDQLTGLLDRAGLNSEMANFRHRGTTVVALIDLDRFKEVNDTFGHAAGDTVLVKVARRLESMTRPTDYLARLGGDELVLVLVGIDSLSSVAPLMSRIRRGIERPVDFDDERLTVGASIGWTTFDDEESFEEALLRADAGMYNAKRDGGGLLRV